MADTVDFSKMLQDAYQDAENDSQGNNPLPERKNPLIKNKDFIPDKGNPLYFRVVPLPDRWFAYGYRQLFVTLTKKDGTNFTTRLTFPRESKSNPIAKSEADQKLENLVNTIIAKNTEARVLNPNLKTDIIKLSNTPYFANIREVWEMPIMIYDMVQENGIVVAKPRVNPSTGAQMVMTLSMSGHTYNDLIKVVKDPINPPQGSTWNPMPIISTGLTYPFSIKRDQFYTVSIKSDVTVPEINPNYFQKDSNGEYMYFDDLIEELPYVLLVRILHPTL